MKIENGEGQVEVIELQLDENGRGIETWDVPADWGLVIFATDDAHELRMIEVGAIAIAYL